MRDQAYFRECYERIDRALHDFRAENFEYVNLVGVFDGLSGADDVFVDSYHFGDKGNEMVAEAIFDRIRDRVARRRAVAAYSLEVPDLAASTLQMPEPRAETNRNTQQ